MFTPDTGRGRGPADTSHEGVGSLLPKPNDAVDAGRGRSSGRSAALRSSARAELPPDAERMRERLYPVSRQSRARQPTFQGPVGHMGVHGSPISATRSREPPIERPVEGVSLHGFGEWEAERRREGGEGLGGLGWLLWGRLLAVRLSAGMTVGRDGCRG